MNKYDFDMIDVDKEDVINRLNESISMDLNRSIGKCIEEFLQTIECTDTYNYTKFILYKNIELILYNTLSRYVYQKIDKYILISLNDNTIKNIIKGELSKYSREDLISSKLKKINEEIRHQFDIISNSRLDELKYRLEPSKKNVEYFLENKKELLSLEESTGISEDYLNGMQEIFKMFYLYIDMIQRRGIEIEVKSIFNFLENNNKIKIYDFSDESFITDIEMQSYELNVDELEICQDEDKVVKIKLDDIWKIDEDKIYLHKCINIFRKEDE